MEKEYNKYINKRMAWKKIQEMFPNKWAALTEYEIDEYSQLKSGVLRAICTDDELIGVDSVIGNKYKKIFWIRTTDALGVNLL
jgi:hypothetical protein